jgi:hypothetical protein
MVIICNGDGSSKAKPRAMAEKIQGSRFIIANNYIYCFQHKSFGLRLLFINKKGYIMICCANLNNLCNSIVKKAKSGEYNGDDIFNDEFFVAFHKAVKADSILEYKEFQEKWLKEEIREIKKMKKIKDKKREEKI